MLRKLKDALKPTFIYTIYCFFIRNGRKLKKRVKKFFGKIKKKIREKTNPLYRYYIMKKLYPRIYKKYSKLPVDENKIVFVELRLPTLTNSFKFIYDELYANYDFDLHCHFLRNFYTSRTDYRNRCKAFIRDIATAKYVFMDEATNINGNIQMRPETIVTQLWHGCGAFKKFGMSTADAIFGATREQMEKYPFNRNYTHVTVSSPEVIWAYEEAMNYTHESGVIKALGSSRTDIFYDENFKKSSYDALYELMPQAQGKKVILYAPTFRGRVARAEAPKNLNMELMQYVLGDEYVLIVKHHPLVRKRPKIPKKCADFAMDMSVRGLTIEQLICVSDICISDYSSLVFEYSLFERPMIFLAYDLDKYFDWRGFYYDYFELAPGPVVNTTTEIVDYIKNIDENFDKKRVHDFREKFMSSCDGHATQRIIETVMSEEEREKHRRKEPLEKLEYHLIPSYKDFDGKKYSFEK
ncbi:MAG: CDP-glycerol glycerophosphotransferase family protein [Acutalibacteraceae bacterium]